MKKRFLQYNNNLEDIVQDIFLKAYRNIQSFDTSRKFSSWLYRVAHNEFINEIRKNTRNPFSFLEPDVLALYPSPEATVKDYERKEILHMLEVSINSLEQKYREVLILYYDEEFSYKEIADILKIPMATVGVRLQRAKQRLKLLYKKLDKHE